MIEKLLQKSKDNSVFIDGTEYLVKRSWQGGPNGSIVLLRDDSIYSLLKCESKDGFKLRDQEKGSETYIPTEKIQL